MGSAGLFPQRVEVSVPGHTLCVRARRDSFWSEYQRGSWEPDTCAVFQRFLDRQHSYIDIGAWIGPTLLLGCPLARQAYGIEADPIAFAELSENMESNRPLTDNVQLFNICIASEGGMVAFGSRGDGGDSTSSLLFADGKTAWEVQGHRLDEWVAERGIQDCNLIKIDIEGGEYAVVPTMAEYLKRNRPTVYLSLHPCFLGLQHSGGVLPRFKRALHRFRSAVRVLRALSFYRHVYDPRGKVGSGIQTFRSRFRDRLAKLNWKPMVLLLTTLYSTRGGNTSLVFTDQRW